ncbi:alkane hydroxylase MAH1-like [Coffea arabica]|uniref:Alkane hydroxylase MAH1-like n=1 Tax=Coffea arabica TaxID=13443 RepID=A0ABM4UZ56_COFAR
MAPRSFFRTILWLIDRWIFRDRNKLPRKLPFFGVLPAVLFTYNKLHDAIVEHLQMIGRTSYLIKLPWFVNMDIVGTVDPDDVYHVMIANFANYPKGPEMKRIFDVLGDGIFTSDFDPWKNQRKLARLLINHQRFQKFMVKTNWDKVEQGLIPVLEHFAENSQIVDMQDVFQRLTFDTTSKFITGYDPGCLAVDFPEVEFAKAMDEVEEAIVMRYFLPENVLKFLSFVGIGRMKTTSKAYATLDQAIAKYISMKKEELKKGNKSYEGDDNGEGFDLLTSYVKEGERMGMVFDDKFFRDTTLNLMIAGRDTTSSGLTWFLWLVSTHPEVEKKIREELKASISPSGEEDEKFRIFKFDEIKNLVYLHAALCETLRLYPPVPFQHKTPHKPDILPSGLHVTPKMKVMFPLYAMGRMESIWGKDCKEFKPERWISERGRVKHEPSYKFLAFNAGPRTCLGKEVAFTQMKAVAAAIIHNYNIQLVEGHPVIPNVSVILYIKNGLKVRVTKRWK